MIFKLKTVTIIIYSFSKQNARKGDAKIEDFNKGGIRNHRCYYIASHSLNGNAVTTPEIAKRQNISKKYLEQILSSLSSAGLVRGQKGSNGGYVIAKNLKEITFKDIINALDANVLSNVYFNTRGDDDVMIRLIDNSLWSKMSSYLQEYAESITLAQLCDEYIKNNEIEHNIPMYYI